MLEAQMTERSKFVCVVLLCVVIDGPDQPRDAGQKRQTRPKWGDCRVDDVVRDFCKEGTICTQQMRPGWWSSLAPGYLIDLSCLERTMSVDLSSVQSCSNQELEDLDTRRSQNRSHVDPGQKAHTFGSQKHAPEVHCWFICFSRHSRLSTVDQVDQRAETAWRSCAIKLLLLSLPPL